MAIDAEILKRRHPFGQQLIESVGQFSESVVLQDLQEAKRIVLDFMVDRPTMAARDLVEGPQQMIRGAKGEMRELMREWAKTVRGKEKTNLRVEAEDVVWYIASASLLAQGELSPGEVRLLQMGMNLVKLMERKYGFEATQLANGVQKKNKLNYLKVVRQLEPTVGIEDGCRKEQELVRATRVIRSSRPGCVLDERFVEEVIIEGKTERENEESSQRKIPSEYEQALWVVRVAAVNGMRLLEEEGLGAWKDW